jgi:hypothetical protein
LPQYLLASFDLSKKPGFFHPRAQIRNRVFVTIFASQFRFIEKTRFLTTTRQNPVSLTPVQAVHRCEIVDFIGKLQMATHPTIWKIFNFFYWLLTGKKICGTITYRIF